MSVTMFDDPIKLLRQLKGAPLAVLLAMYWTRMRITAEWLVTVTGYTDKPVTSALKLLSAYGWITKVQNGWQISAGVQLPLGGGEVVSENFRSGSSSLITDSILINREDEEESRKNSDSFIANFRLMKSYGIREPALSRLSALEHVNPEFINAHVRAVRVEKGYLGTAIHRIENNWPAPEYAEESKPPRRHSDSLFAFVNRDDEPEEQGK